MDDVREEARDGRGVKALLVLVVGETEAVAVAVAGVLFGGESVLAVCV